MSFSDLLSLLLGFPQYNKRVLGIYLSFSPLRSFFQSQDVYSSYKDVPQENFAEVLLRTGKLAEAKTEGKTLFPATEGKDAENAYTQLHTEKCIQIEKILCGLFS